LAHGIAVSSPLDQAYPLCSPAYASDRKRGLAGEVPWQSWLGDDPRRYDATQQCRAYSPLFTCWQGFENLYLASRQHRNWQAVAIEQAVPGQRRQPRTWGQ